MEQRERQEGLDPAVRIFHAVLAAVDPYTLVCREADRVVSAFRRGGYRRLLVAAFGKAAFPMTAALVDTSVDIALTGAVVTKDGHLGIRALPASIACFEAAHPVPDGRCVAAAGEIVRALREAGEETLVVCLISGGGSALLAAPLPPITLREKQEATRALLEAGADIRELNTVRKHISLVKGGRLAAMACPAGVLSLILSDVIGDRLDVIASGPTAPDRSTYREALAVIDRYALRARIPAAVTDLLERGVRGEIPETPKAGDACFERVSNVIIGNNRIAAEAAAAKAREAGYDTTILTTELHGEAREAGKWLAGKAREARRSVCRTSGRKVCLVSGGETTVAVRGSGRGGRNMELALAFAMAARGMPGVTLLSAGTDGTDGPTDAAGAVVDGGTAERAEAAGLAAESYLANNDSYNFFKAAGGLLMTGPTGTNVMDIQIMLLD